MTTRTRAGTGAQAWILATMSLAGAAVAGWEAAVVVTTAPCRRPAP